MEMITYGGLQGFLGMGLTRRELEFTLCAAHGMTDKETARVFGVAPSTIKQRIRSAMYHLDAKRRTELVMLAMKRGIIAPLAVLLMACSVVNGASPDLERAPRGKVRVTRSIRAGRRDTDLPLFDNPFDYV